MPLDVQDIIEAVVSEHMVRPQSARWKFAFMIDAGSQKLVCGSVDFESAMRRYIGPQRFYAYVQSGKVTLYQLQDPPFLDPAGAEAADFHRLCDR